MCKGIKIVIDYFTSRGHEVIGFLPDYLFDGGKSSKPVQNPENPEEEQKEVKACQQPDDLAYL
jgi:hypothetical protein